jgi:hypothetical protein
VLRLYVKIFLSAKSFRDRLSLSGEICQELMRQIGGKVWWGLGKIDLRENCFTKELFMKSLCSNRHYRGIKCPAPAPERVQQTAQRSSERKYS